MARHVKRRCLVNGCPSLDHTAVKQQVRIQTDWANCLKEISYCLFEFFAFSWLRHFSTPQPIAKSVICVRRPPPILIQDLIPAFSWILLWHPGGAGHSSNPPLLQFLCHLLHLHLLHLDPHLRVPLIMGDIREMKKVPVQVSLALMMRFWMGQLLRKMMVCSWTSLNFSF